MKLSRLKEWRERRAMTQTDLAEMAGVSQDGVSKIERGVRGCHPNTAKRLSAALGVPVGELVAPPEVVAGSPKDLTPRLLKRSLDEAGLTTTWALTDHEDLLAEGARLTRDELRERMIPEMRAEQRVLRREAANPDLPLEVRDYVREMDEELGLRMMELLTEARRRERTHEGRRQLAEAQQEILADAS